MGSIGGAMLKIRVAPNWRAVEGSAEEGSQHGLQKDGGLQAG